MVLSTTRYYTEKLKMSSISYVLSLKEKKKKEKFLYGGENGWKGVYSPALSAYTAFWIYEPLVGCSMLFWTRKIKSWKKVVIAISKMKTFSCAPSIALVYTSLRMKKKKNTIRKCIVLSEMYLLPNKCTCSCQDRSTL